MVNGSPPLDPASDALVIRRSLDDPRLQAEVRKELLEPEARELGHIDME